MGVGVHSRLKGVAQTIQQDVQCRTGHRMREEIHSNSGRFRHPDQRGRMATVRGGKIYALAGGCDGAVRSMTRSHLLWFVCVLARDMFAGWRVTSNSRNGPISWDMTLTVANEAVVYEPSGGGSSPAEPVPAAAHRLTTQALLGLPIRHTEPCIWFRSLM